MALSNSHKQALNSLITFAAAVRQAERLAKAIGMFDELKSDSKLTHKLVDKLPSANYKTSVYNYLQHGEAMLKVCEIFAAWLEAEDDVAMTTREQVVLTKDLTTPWLPQALLQCSAQGCGGGIQES